MRFVYLVAVALVALAVQARAEQPIFDEMPRWTGGWGYQVLQEYRHERGLYDGQTSLGSSLDRSAHILHVQGVYTWHRSIRLTAKLPVVLEAERQVLSANGEVVEHKQSGLGDIAFALPLKKYFNLDGRSGSWTFAPQLIVPGATAESDKIGIYFRELAGGVSLGYETETYDYIVRAGLGSVHYAGDVPSQYQANFTLGLNFFFGSRNGHLKLHQQLRHQVGIETTYALLPTLYLRWTDLVHFQIRTSHDIYEHRTGPIHGKMHSARFGVGFVY